jgi:hypothetical protein
MSLNWSHWAVSFAQYSFNALAIEVVIDGRKFKNLNEKAGKQN